MGSCHISKFAELLSVGVLVSHVKVKGQLINKTFPENLETNLQSYTEIICIHERCLKTLLQLI